VWGFAGGFIDRGDATGLVQFGQRYYDPAVGRWTQQDPVGPRTNYLYAGDDPVNLVDPSGLKNGHWWDPTSWDSKTATRVLAGTGCAVAAGGVAASIVASAGTDSRCRGSRAVCRRKLRVQYRSWRSYNQGSQEMNGPAR
ncbi:MAG: RHS repeat-associated core domain-containing protein, partial [Actinobacteria bacterium]|nr:RHS repeat-associated core domain-containing protein [Actinomycetota bacterium]